LGLSKNKEIVNRRCHELESKYCGTPSYDEHRAGFISRMIESIHCEVRAEAEKRVEHRPYNNTSKTNLNIQIDESKACFGIN
jgi:hypothetical protein